MKCRVCNNIVSEGVSFCPVCGSKLVKNCGNEIKDCTISKEVLKEGRYINQSKGKGEYAHCIIKFYPYYSNEGISFSSTTNEVPSKYYDAIQKGIHNGMETDFGGKKIKSIICELIGGSYHAIDSNNEAFEKVAYNIFLELMKEVDLKPIDNET